ncbi:AMIN-like domain-containing (lipo)protein [Pseudarthrobacter sp. J1738]|uniref:AMIN-like domain-containing (lipo)protein n=1 Tax=Pseudarthrobacter sp. J1738 TaxID=3420446 RepID=UPI003D2CF6E4
MKKVWSFIAAAVLLTGGLGVVSAPANGATVSCSVDWGSLTKTQQHSTTAALTNVRTGHHDCFDRLVIDISGKGAGYSVSYVSAVHQEGSGLVVPLRGGAFLNVVLRAPAYTSTGASSCNPINRKELTSVLGYQTFRQVAFAGSFEGQTTLGLGVRARLPFRVFTLDGPGAGSRVVIDVAHRW